MKSKEEVTAVEGETKPALVPKLRFPEFRDAQVWEEATLSKFIRSLDAGVSVNAGDRPASKAELGVLKTSCVSNGVFDPNENKVVSNELEKARLTESVTANSIIISRMNTPALVGANSYIEENAENLFLPDRLWAAKPQDGVSMRFLAHILGSDAGRSALSNLAKGSSGSMKNITKPDVLALRVIAPSYCEQQKIADCLSSLDELIAAQARKVDALKTHKKGLMQQLFPREAETQPRLRFPEFQNTGEWGHSSMGTLLMSSPDYGVNAAAVPFSEQLPKYLRITDISDDGRYLSEKRVSVDLQATDGDYLEEGDIVLARTGASVGKSYEYRKEDGRFVFAGFLIRVRANPEKLESTYLANFLKTDQFWSWVEVTSARSGQPGINSTEYSSLPIPLPPSLAEQQRIASCLSSLDTLITAATQKLETLKTHKKGLMQQLFPSPDEATA